MPFQSASLREALRALGEVLADRGLVHDVAVIGGGALLLSGHIERPTKDLDIVARVIGDTWMRVADRVDQIAFKVYAAADHWPLQGKHLQDLQVLVPTRTELIGAARWCTGHDPSAGFRDVQLAPVLERFGVAIGDVEAADD